MSQQHLVTKRIHMKDQLHIEMEQMPKAHPPTSSDPRESHLWVHPHKVKQGPTQRYSNKSFITQAHHSEVPRLTVRTHSQKDFNDIRCQEAPDDGVAETAEEHTFTQSKKNRRWGRATHVQPWAESKICTDKNKQDSSRIHFLYPDASSVFRNYVLLPEMDIHNAS